MHESSIARSVMSAVLERAAREGATRVRVVRGWIAETEALSPECVQLHFTWLARGTLAQGAVLRLDLRRVSADAEIVGPTGVAVESIDVED